MPVDPHLAGLLQLIAEVGVPAHEGTPEEARAAFRQLTVGGRRPEHVVPVASTEDVQVAGADGDLHARVYRPEGDGPFPTVVMFHGGGWVIGDLETHDNGARSICRDARAVVVSVDYRLAPEAPFPAAVDDAIAATEWVARHLAELGGDERLAVAGDSAGGNLAAVVAQHRRYVDAPPLVGQLLIYPAVDVVGNYPSRTENATGYFLDQPTMAWFMAQYAADRALHADPRLSPILTEDLSGVAPAVVVTAGFDPLRDEGEAYAGRLEDAGVATEVRRFGHMIHGFFDMGAISPGAQSCIDESCALFGKLLHS